MSQVIRHTTRQVTRLERIPTGNERVSGLGRREVEPVAERPAQRTAHLLIEAERGLSDVETRYIEAKRAWTDALRHSAQGTDAAAELATAQGALDLADHDRDNARKRVDDLRHQLQEQRRHELLAQAVAEQHLVRDDVRRRVEQTVVKPSLFDRLFGRS